MQVCGLNDVKCLAENSKYWRQLALPPPDLKASVARWQNLIPPSFP